MVGPFPLAEFAGATGQQRSAIRGSRVNENNWSIDGTTFSDGVDNTQTRPSGQLYRIVPGGQDRSFQQLGRIRVRSVR